MRWLIVALALCAACGDDAPTGVDPDTAPRATIDRFGAAGSIFSRESDSSLPAAGEPIDLDSFTTRGYGPNGETAVYYNLDVQSRVPLPMYELVDSAGELFPGQLPIVDALPGDDGYSDFWRVTRVRVADDYVANTFTAYSDLAGLRTEVTDILLNRPMVPEGSTASVRIDGGDTATLMAWYRGQVVHYFAFDEHDLTPVPVGLFAGQVPISYIFVTFNINPGDTGGGLPSGFKTEPGTDQTHNVLATIPDDDDYSPLWMVNVYDNAEFDDVSDRQSAFAATLLATPPGEVNCPVRSLE